MLEAILEGDKGGDDGDAIPDDEYINEIIARDDEYEIFQVKIYIHEGLSRIGEFSDSLHESE